MSKMKHTPGPWTVGYKALHVMAENAKIGGNTPICDIRGWGYLTGNGHGALGLKHEEAAAIQEANARLISAAPDLLEALKALRNACIGMVPECAPMVDAAILKAEGDIE